MKVKVMPIENGMQIKFLFPDGGESPVFKSQEEACEAAADLYKNNSVDEIEFSDLISRIMKQKKLPFDGSIEKSIVVAMSMIGGLALSGSMSIYEKAKKGFYLAFNIPSKVRFEMCECGSIHGRIFHRRGVTNALAGMRAALFIAESLHNDESLSDEELEEVKSQIRSSPLPE